MNRARSLTLVALLAAGCIPDTKKLDPFASATSSCPVLFDVFTAKLHECAGLAPYLTDVYYANAAQSCGVVAAAEAAGRIGYDRAKMETCINGVRAAGCGGLGNACSDIPFVARVPVGGTCYNDLECAAPALGCYASNACPGTCMAGGGSGARCSDIDPPCGAAYFCDGSSTTAQPTCAARAGLGGSCASVPCVPNTYCSLGVCVNQLSSGSACTGYGQCNDAQGLYCDTSATPSTCKAPVVSNVGGRCDYPNRCTAGLWCDHSGTSQVCRAPLSAGAACSASTSNGCSMSGLTCVSGTCQAYKGEGTTCTPGNGECQGGLYCASGSPSRCTRWPGLGGACGTIAGEYVSCASGTYCPSGGGTCQATIAPGTICPSYNACGSNGFGFTRAQCMRLPAAGAATTLTCVAACRP